MRPVGCTARVGAFPADSLTDKIDGRSSVANAQEAEREAMPNLEVAETELRYRLSEIVRRTPPLLRVLSVARHLRLPDWLVFSGAVYQPVLNHLTGRPLDCKSRFRRAAAEHGRGSE